MFPIAEWEVCQKCFHLAALLTSDLFISGNNLKIGFKSDDWVIKRLSIFARRTDQLRQLSSRCCCLGENIENHPVGQQTKVETIEQSCCCQNSTTCWFKLRSHWPSSVFKPTTEDGTKKEKNNVPERRRRWWWPSDLFHLLLCDDLNSPQRTSFCIKLKWQAFSSTFPVM